MAAKYFAVNFMDGPPPDRRDRVRGHDGRAPDRDLDAGRGVRPNARFHNNGRNKGRPTVNPLTAWWRMSPAAWMKATLTPLGMVPLLAKGELTAGLRPPPVRASSVQPVMPGGVWALA